MLGVLFSGGGGQNPEEGCLFFPKKKLRLSAGDFHVQDSTEAPETRGRVENGEKQACEQKVRVTKIDHTEESRSMGRKGEKNGLKKTIIKKKKKNRPWIRKPRKRQAWGGGGRSNYRGETGKRCFGRDRHQPRQILTLNPRQVLTSRHPKGGFPSTRVTAPEKKDQVITQKSCLSWGRRG